ncbi:tyrosine--tRNA ligase [Candidatus Falkowbacteria bacterium RIFOXYB2_FULL_38_15]|uniref:Tyrosine--tRNA ligase n=1 Tax=Candidatus Falkowbacteria bacterium RIFOXYA2_FULL_38_12 TaxID=1797993 RepID=A0A1F5S4M0_9BACT|nr:MAG: tyrosine--tRNA ligase [Candidatus Falkowbacteria bacterium RIFOXYA2_FULL_38_12]OGF32749.1 MAG: tyrosine--tRNA ligase [Candidatus Falkowbacteria bacterium RIFOXYB2_FULL_38_15]OGF42215.1 MAG: tyrosine--tRNA ligase [Candidatus Falkowbacteria bacterium RIFOXYD2_FULL_39_16]
MKINTDEKKIEELLTRGVENIYPSRKDFEKVLMSGKQLTIYNGIDPTGPTLHIGHGSTLLKLRELQDLGHKIILLIGDFTGMIGDPTDKTATRKKLTRKEVLENCKNYAKQAGKILDMKKVEIKYNSKWLGKLVAGDFLELGSEITVQQLLERDMFKKRTEEGKPIYLHEFIYPLLQGYDSVAMNVDVEIGGNDQTFNMLVGRDMMKNRGKEKFVLTTKLLVDPTGKKMGKSEGNMVTLEDMPEDMYGKVMSWPDTLMPLAFEICTRVSINEFEKVLAGDPREAKMRLAREIVSMYHSESAAQKAEENFVKTFSKKETPDEIKEVAVKSKNILDVLVEVGFCSSKGEARRNIEQGGVTVSGEVVKDFNFEVKSGEIIKKGKRYFVKIK